MVQNDLDRYLTHFYAIVGDEILRVADFTKKDNNRAYHKRYKNQIGWLACRNGWIEYVWVNDGKATILNTRLTQDNVVYHLF